MRPVELLQRLIRFDTTNPPGNEAECIEFIGQLLEEAGVKTEVCAQERERPNLVARIAGKGNGEPLLLQGHVDVVTTSGQTWQRQPFAGELVDGYVWGRGAIDMKGHGDAGVGVPARGVRDRPGRRGAAGSAQRRGGRRRLRRQVPGRGASAAVRGDPEALGEFGGFSTYIAGRRFYQIQVAEKQICFLRATIRRRGGHGAMIHRGGAMARLGRFLGDLDSKRLPIHITPAAREMVERMAAALPQPHRGILRSLPKPRLLMIDPLVLGTGRRLFVEGGPASFASSGR